MTAGAAPVHALTSRLQQQRFAPVRQNRHTCSGLVTPLGLQQRTLRPDGVRQLGQPVACNAQKPARSSSGPKQASGQGKDRRAQAAQEEEEDEEDGFLDDEVDLDGEDFEGQEGEEGYEDEEDEDEDEEGGADYGSSFLEPDDAPREVATGGTAWGEAVLRATQAVLQQPALQGLELYLFRCLPANRKVDIRLDKLDDAYGSPSIDDIERFQRALLAALERELGAEAAGEISFEVSSPGAERLVQVPGELGRFGQLPLQVEYVDAEGRAASSVLLLDSLDEVGRSSAWRTANVRANAPVKGRPLSKRQLAAVTQIPLDAITRVRIHVDF